MSRCPTFTFKVSIMSKLLAKHISFNVSFKITIRERHVYMTFVDLENETSNSVWEFEKMNVQNIIFAFFSASYTLKFTEQNEKVY